MNPRTGVSSCVCHQVTRTKRCNKNRRHQQHRPKSISSHSSISNGNRLMMMLFMVMMILVDSITAISSPSAEAGNSNSGAVSSSSKITTTSHTSTTTTTSTKPTTSKYHSLLERLVQDSNQSKLWKHLGKMLLDDGEYAESRRVFCYASKYCCPDDKELQHHVKVYNTFHNHQDNDNNENEAEDKEEQTAHETEEDVPPNAILPPTTTTTTLPTNDIMANIQNYFLSMDVPSDAIPDTILNYPYSNIKPSDRRRLIHASTIPILTKECCRYIINEAIQTTNKIGWTIDRHVQAPTCDVPVFNLDAKCQRYISNMFHTTILPMLCKLVDPELCVEPNQLDIQDCFVVRYDADTTTEESKVEKGASNNKNVNPGFTSLKPHQDESILSLTISLNDDYENGGLYIHSTGDVLDGPTGTILCFAGSLIHGGYPITNGTRWILTVFLYVDVNQSGCKENGYILKEYERLLALKEKIKE